MCKFIEALEGLTGKSCGGLSIQESIGQCTHCPGLYENPKQFIITMVDALPNPREAWLLLFFANFMISTFAGDQLQNSEHATEYFVGDSVPPQKHLACKCSLPKESQGL